MARVNKFVMLAPYIREYSLWNLPYFTFLIPRTLKWVVGFGKNNGTLFGIFKHLFRNV
jgi:hypothetical protein